MRVKLAASASFAAREAKGLLEEAEFELREQRQLESHLHKGLAVKAVSSFIFEIRPTHLHALVIRRLSLDSSG